MKLDGIIIACVFSRIVCCGAILEGICPINFGAACSAAAAGTAAALPRSESDVARPSYTLRRLAIASVSEFHYAKYCQLKLIVNSYTRYPINKHT